MAFTSLAVDWTCLSKEWNLPTLPLGRIRELSMGTQNDVSPNFAQFWDRAHYGQRDTYPRLKVLFHWPGMKSDLSSTLNNVPRVKSTNGSVLSSHPWLLKPLPAPDSAWTHISIEVEGLPTSNNKDLIPVVVGRFTKYAMKQPIHVSSVANTFTENISKLHGLPPVIVNLH